MRYGYRLLKFTPQIHQRHSIRLKGYDYSLPGAYFITLVTKGYISLFGKVSNGFMNCNYLGEITQSVWQRLPDFFSIELDHWVIMPNHLHGIIWLKDAFSGEASAIVNYQKSVNLVADASPKQIWQRNYYDRIIRDEKELNRIRQYIIENPHQWSGNLENLYPYYEY